METPCPTCGGSGSRRRTRSFQVRVPAGVKDGARIRLAGRGEPGPAGGQPGDLYVRVRVRPHAFFGRKGHDLTLELPVTYAEAALGANVQVPTLDGPVTMKVPARDAERQDVPAQGQGRAEARRPRRPAGHRQRRGAAEALEAGEGPAEAALAGGEGVAAPPSRRRRERAEDIVDDEQDADRTGGRRTAAARSAPSTSSAWPPSSPACIRRRSACTSARACSQPKRTSGNTRRYSERDIERIRTIQELTQRRGHQPGRREAVHRDAGAARARCSARTAELERELSPPRAPGRHGPTPRSCRSAAAVSFPWEEDATS